MEFQVREFGSISWCGTLFVMSWSDVIGVVCGSVAMAMCPHHLAGGHWVARSYNHGLMLSFPGNCGSSSLPDWIGILPLRPIRRVVDALVPPVPGVQSALRYLLFLGIRAIWQMLSHRLNCGLIQLLANASLSFCCHEVVSFYYCGVHNCAELVLICWVSLETAVVSGVLRGLDLIVATLWRVRVHSTPGSVLVCTILVLLSIASFVIHHLRRSHGRSSCCGCV